MTVRRNEKEKEEKRVGEGRKIPRQDREPRSNVYRQQDDDSCAINMSIDLEGTFRRQNDCQKIRPVLGFIVHQDHTGRSDPSISSSSSSTTSNINSLVTPS